MNFKKYQQATKEFACYPLHQAREYLMNGLVSEVGEISDKIKKTMRDHDGIFTEEKKEAIGKEIGDCLWYLSELASFFGLDLQEIADGNIAKLESRKERDKIKGSGDER